MLSHGQLILGKHFRPFISPFIFDGVAIFFVLSGYLIGGILIKSFVTQSINGSTILNFWLRRWFRTLPAYILVLSVLIILHLFYFKDISFKDTYKFFYFSQNLFYPHPTFFGEAWSLAVEEWFYFVTPLMMALGLKCSKTEKKQIILFVILATIIIVTMFRIIKLLSIQNVNLTDDDIGYMFTMQVFTRLDAIMYGVLGAYLSYYYKSLWTNYKILLFILGILLVLILEFYNINSLSYKAVFKHSFYSFAILCLLPYFSTLKKSAGFIYNIITYISIISYSMYLLNAQFILKDLLLNISLPFLPITAFVVLRYFFFWVLTIFLSVLLYKYFEAPMTKIRDRFSK